MADYPETADSVRPGAKLVQGNFLTYTIPAAGGSPAGPGEDAWPALSAELIAIRARLDFAKSALDDPEICDRAARTLRSSDLYARLKSRIRKEFGGQAVSNAWLKMFEILGRTGAVADCRRAGRPLRVFCNAEYPGAFVSAINHFLAAADGELDWVASSLHPGRAGVLGDQFGLQAKNPGRWLMDAQMRGDLTSAADIRALAARALGQLGSVDLYTSDAGIDVSADYNRQEELTARIHLGQVLAGLLVVRQGGALIVKMYAFFTRPSVSLIALCASLFRRVDIVKPRASRPANSEVYLVCLGRLAGPGPADVDRLAALASDPDSGQALAGAPRLDTALAGAIALASRTIHGGQQVSFLEEAVRACRAGAPPRSWVSARRGAEDSWLAQNPVRRLAPGSRLPCTG